MSGSDNSKQGSNKISQNSTSSPSSATTDEQITENTQHSKVIEQARKFLQKDEIQDIEKEKKAAFLQTKGLSNDEIEELIGGTEKTDSKAKNLSSPKTSERESQAVKTKTAPQTTPIPIVTYPEFLVNPPLKPSPLLTTSHLINTLYSASFLTATLYGTLEYIVTPMLLRLNDCRHELFNSTLLKLNTLCERLQGQVSEIPVIVKPYISRESDIEAEDIDNDPTKLFHRDIGIQTSPPRSPQPKNSQLAQGPLAYQFSHLCDLFSTLRDANNLLADETNSDSGLEDALSDLRKYLNTVAYPLRSINNYESIYLSNGTMAGYPTGNGTGVDLNEANSVKKEIKGMKGILLSARTFPGVKVGLYQK
ncbi:hypothetical protein HI914_06380 [Erysiphe necator]|nr:hypothetical protein HI914_06380 [Erysiphe necator]